MAEERKVLRHYYNKIFNCDNEDLVFALLNEEEDEIIEFIIDLLPKKRLEEDEREVGCVDVFLVNTFAKSQLAYDNVYAFTSKHFSEISPDQMQYDIIQDNSQHAGYALNKVIRNWQKVKDGGYLILLNIEKDAKEKLEDYFLPLDIKIDSWHEEEGTLIFKK